MERKMRSCLSLALALCLVLGICSNGLAVLAEGAKTGDDEKIVYVSIGDSMTNGYGIEGYDGTSGIANYAMDTFANYFAAYLAGYTGQIVDDQVVFEGINGTVDHRQLAMSGMRPEDVHWLLELDHTNEAMLQDLVYNRIHNSWQDIAAKWDGEYGFQTGDYRTWADLVSPTYRLADGAAKILATYNGEMESYFKSSYSTEALMKAAVAGLARDPYYPSSEADREEQGNYKFLQIAAEFYQESVKDADIVSLALGNTNFGTFMFNEIIDVIYGDTQKFANRYDIERVYEQADLNPVLETSMRVLTDELSAVVDEQFGGLVTTQEAREALGNIVSYCAISYLVNYIGALEAILALNPDVQIIQLSMMNTYKVANQPENVMTVGELADAIYAPINVFLAGLPTLMQATGDSLYQEATFYYAETDIISCMVEVYGDDFYKVDGQYIKYPGLDLSIEGIQPNGNSVVRERFMEYSTGKIFGILAPLAASFGIEGGLDTSLTVETVNAYEMMTPAEKARFIAADSRTAISCALYLAFENAIIRAGRSVVTMDSVAMLGNLGVGMFAGAMANFNKNIGVNGAVYAGVAFDTVLAFAMDIAAAQVEAGIEAQLPVDVTITAKDLTADEAQALANAKNVIKQVICALFDLPIEEFDAVAAAKPAIGNMYQLFCQQYASIIADALMQGYQGAIDGAAAQESSVQQLCMVMALPQTLSDALLSDETVAGVLCLAGRGDLGTGIGTHPSPAGHKTLFDIIVAAYTGNYTVADKTAEYIQILLNMVNGYLNEDSKLEAAPDHFRVYPSSHYLALGDKNAYGPAADLLAAQLQISHKNATVVDQTAAQLLDNIGSLEDDIAGSDLITLGFSANTVFQFALDRLQIALREGEAAPLGWEALIGAEGAACVTQLLKDLQEDLAEQSGNIMGMDKDKLFGVMLESFAYGYIEHMVSVDRLVGAIHRMNPDAQIALVGMHNSMDDVLVDVEGQYFELGGYLQAMVSGVNLYSLGYAYTHHNVSYMAAPAAETVPVAGGSDAGSFLQQLLENGVTRYMPTEAGYAYIAEQMFKGVERMERGSLGDVDSDGDVDYVDSMLTLQYYTQEIGAEDLNVTVADVDGNGVVNYVDSMLILQHYTQEISVFPAA